MNTSIAIREQLWEDAQILAIKSRISFTELVRRAVAVYVSGEYVDEITIESDGHVSPPEAARKLRRIR